MKSIPQSLLEYILQQAQPELPALEGYSVEEMVDLYEAGLLTVDCLGRNPDNGIYGVYKVSAMGDSIVLEVIDGM